MKSDAKNYNPPPRADAPPQVNYAPAPVILFLLLAAGVFGAGLFVDRFGGGFNAKVYAPYQSIEEVTARQPKSAGGELAAKGRQVYERNCLACHQASGQGAPGQFPSLVGSEWVNTENPERMIRILLNGLTGPIMIKGAEFRSDAQMPPWRDTLSDADIAAVITFVRGNKEWSNQAGAVKPEDVKRVRDATADRGAAWTAQELQTVPEK